MHATTDCGRRHGRRGLAAEPGPREVRGGIPRQRDRRDGSSEPDGRAPEAAWRYRTRAPGKLLDAIAALRNEASGKTPSVDATTASSTPSAPPEDRAERRQVTVMFSDLVGSTALSARMDPEDLREVISAYQKCVAETVERFGGFVAKYMGDGVLLLRVSASPRGRRRAGRARRAGVGRRSGDLKTHAALQTRVGIATGLVVVGDLIGSGASQEQAIVGETPNLAARLQGIAEPNSVVIAESTRKLVGNLFELEDLGAQDLKGIAGSVRAWAALRPLRSRAASRPCTRAA